MKTYFAIPAVVLLTVLMSGCSTAPKTEAARDTLVDEAQAALKRMMNDDPGLEAFLDRSYAYAVFPSVGKGGLVAGGAYGRGAVYEGKRFVGYADLTQATVGLQAGGQTFSELVVFETREAFERFKTGKLSFAANVSAVAVKAGAAASARFNNGVAVFVKPNGGLMFEASIGGQQFTFVPPRS